MNTFKYVIKTILLATSTTIVLLTALLQGVAEGSVGEGEVGVEADGMGKVELGVSKGSVGEGDAVRIKFLAL